MNDTKIPLDTGPYKGQLQPWAWPMKSLFGDSYRLAHWKKHKKMCRPFAGPKGKLP